MWSASLSSSKSRTMNSHDASRGAALDLVGWTKPSRPSVVSGVSARRQRGDDLARQPDRVDELALGRARVRVDAADRDDDLLGVERLVLDLAEIGAVERVGAAAPNASTSKWSAPPPISSSTVKQTRSGGGGSSGCAARYATAAMISATPALSSAPSSVCRGGDDVVADFVREPAAPVEHGAARGSSIGAPS